MSNQDIIDVEATEVEVEATQEQPTLADYTAFIQPLIAEIRNAVTKVGDEYPNQFDEFDVYNALALNITLFAMQFVAPENREAVEEQSKAIAGEMFKSCVNVAQEQSVLLSSMLVGAARAVSYTSDIVKDTVDRHEAAQQAQEQAE